MAFNDFKLNDIGDIFTSSGDFAIVDGREAIAQNIEQRLKTIVGEWFLNVGLYVDYFGAIFEKGTPASIIESEIRDVIAETPGFEAFQTFTIDIDSVNRQLEVSFEASTVEGVIELNNILIGQEF